MSGYWNYRMVLRNEEIGIYSVYYDAQGRVEGASQEPQKVMGYSVEGLADTLQQMNECMAKPLLTWENIENEE